MNYVTDEWGLVYLTRREAADYLGIGVGKLSTLIRWGAGPTPIYWGTKARFLKCELDAFNAAFANCKAPPGSAQYVVPDWFVVDGMVTSRDTAKVLGVPMRTLAYRRAQGRFPLPVQVGKQRMYRVGEVAQYLTFLRWKAEKWV